MDALREETNTTSMNVCGNKFDAPNRCSKVLIIQVTLTTYNKTNVLDFSDPHIDLLTFVDRQANVKKIVFMGHTTDLHEGKQVTLIEASLILKGLDSTPAQSLVNQFI